MIPLITSCSPTARRAIANVVQQGYARRSVPSKCLKTSRVLDLTGDDTRTFSEGDEKAQIQAAPFSDESVTIVQRLLRRTDIEQPGTVLLGEFGITPDAL